MKSRAKYLREWRKKNPTKASEHNRNYRLRHPDRDKASRLKEKTKYIKKGRYRVSEEQKRKNATEYAKKWREKNREKVRESNRKHYHKHKDLHQLHSRNYKSKVRAGKVGRVSVKDIAKLLEKQKNICGICKKLLTKEKEIDHIIPLSKGGKHEISNLQWTHRFCNRSKSNKII